MTALAEMATAGDIETATKMRGEWAAQQQMDRIKSKYGG